MGWLLLSKHCWILIGELQRKVLIHTMVQWGEDFSRDRGWRGEGGWRSRWYMLSVPTLAAVPSFLSLAVITSPLKPVCLFQTITKIKKTMHLVIRVSTQIFLGYAKFTRKKKPQRQLFSKTLTSDYSLTAFHDTVCNDGIALIFHTAVFGTV